jgi:O-antigen/teichoic acid export membrane protein
MPAAIADSGTYFAAQVLLLLAGLVSMPLMTRLLSKAEYGRLGIALTAAAVLAGVGRLGFGDAAVRLYSEYRQRGELAVRELCETLLTGTVLASAAVTVTAVLAMRHTALAASVPAALIIALAGIRAVTAVVLQITRAQERAAVFARAQLAMRYGTTAIAVAALLCWERTAIAVIAASLLVELAVLGWQGIDLHRCGLIARPRLSPPLVGALAYGLPLALAGSARYLLAYGDRLLLGHLLGLEAVATYSVSYDVLQRLGDIFTVPVQLALAPVLFRLWEEAGAEAASRAASRALTYVLALAIPVSALYLLYNRAVLVLIASGPYAESAALTPYLLPGMWCESFSFFALIALAVHKRTWVLALTVCAAAALNLTLNLVLIPLCGVIGAAVASTVANAVMLSAQWQVAPRSIRLDLDRAVVAKAALATAAAVALLAIADRLHPNGVWELAVDVGMGATAALALFAALDADVRRLLGVPRWRWIGETDAPSG